MLNSQWYRDRNRVILFDSLSAYHNIFTPISTCVLCFVTSYGGSCTFVPSTDLLIDLSLSPCRADTWDNVHNTESPRTVWLHEGFTQAPPHLTLSSVHPTLYWTKTCKCHWMSVGLLKQRAVLNITDFDTVSWVLDCNALHWADSSDKDLKSLVI